LATLGRSGAVLTGRLDPSGAVTLVITAATLRPGGAAVRPAAFRGPAGR
jgi:hypothetical protein